jgi:hypothetical protein
MSIFESLWKEDPTKNNIKGLIADQEALCSEFSSGYKKALERGDRRHANYYAEKLKDEERKLTNLRRAHESLMKSAPVERYKCQF